MTYKNLHDIRARVTARWKHGKCKFQRGDTALVNERVLPGTFKGRELPHWTSRKQQSRAGQTGTVIAVSCVSDGRIRGDGNRRQYTRYYVQFADQQIQGFDSHYLDNVS